MISTGIIAITDLAWHDGLAGWLPLSQVISFVGTAPQQPPPITPGQTSGAGPGIPSGPEYSDWVYPKSPPRSIGWMTFWGFMWPGLGQLLCGQKEKGIVMMVASTLLGAILSVTIVLPPAMCIAGAIDAHRVATCLASGRPVKKWAFFPR